MTKRGLAMVLVTVMLMTVGAGYASASHVSSTQDSLENDIAAYVRDWVLEQYSEHYHLSNYRGDIAQIEVVNDEFRAFVPVVVYTTLKYDSAESVPYVQGMKSALGISSMKDTIRSATSDPSRLSDSALAKANPQLDLGTVKALTVMLSDLYSDIEECVGIATELSVDFVVTGRIDANGIAGSISLFVDDMDGLVDANLYVPKSKDALRDDGETDVSSFKERAKEKASQQTPRSVDGYDDYDRIAARDYALTYTSNAEAYCHCGDLYGVDYDYWNNSEYPYFDNACHDDCTDYVSQAMHAGGIPIDPGEWERLEDGESEWGDGTGWTWTYVPSLEDYMTSMGYWDDSTFAECNAGNILLTSSSHIVMITLNDSVTHRYSGHTRDRRNYEFYDSSSYDYYAIETT